MTENKQSIDEEDAFRPTVDEPTNATGWIAYYAWGKGGHGIHKPNFMYWNEPMEDIGEVEALSEHIIHTREPWMEHAERCAITIHRGVTPPAQTVRDQFLNAKEGIRMTTNRAARYAAQMKIYCPEEDRQYHAYHPATTVLIEGLKTLGVAGAKVLTQWDIARRKIDE